MTIQFKHRQLENGLTVLAEVNPNSHTAAIGFFVRTGARDESQDIMGVSHFLEHMMFKGTARRTADDVNREFDEIGANYNAYTSQENTVYWAHVLPDYLLRAVDLIGDMLRPALRTDDFNMEKKVILEEIEMYEDRPQWRLQDAAMEHHFAPHALSFRVLGTSATVGSLQVEQMHNYFERRYSPDNVVVAAAGRLDFEMLFDALQRATGHWQPAGARRTCTVPQLSENRHEMVDQKLNRHYVLMICPGPSAQDPQRYAAGVVSYVLGDGDGSRLHWALVDPGLADEVEISCLNQDRVGSFIAYASCDPGRAQQVEQVMLETLDGYLASIDTQEIERAKNKMATETTLVGESPSGRMRNIGGTWTYLGEYIPLSQHIEHMMAVTAQDARDLVDAAGFSPRTIVTLGPTSGN